MTANANTAWPLVSVIIRSKGRATLQKALDSVSAQTYPNIEVVLVNARGAGHWQVGESCGRFPMRMVECGKALRRSAAANAGMENAHGDYLIFLDDDDWFEADHIQKLAGAIRQSATCQVVYTGVRCVDEHDHPLSEKFDSPFDAVQMLAGNTIPIHAVLFARELLDTGCRMDESLDLYEDWDFWIQLSTYCNFLQVDGLSAVYRITQQSGFGVNADLATSDAARWAVYKKWFGKLGDHQIQGLMETVQLSPRKDFHISHLQQTADNLQDNVADLNQTIAALNQTVADLNQTIADLDQSVIERDQRIAKEQLRIDELEPLSRDLQTAIENISLSNSWRITAPLRAVSKCLRWINRPVRLYRNYRRRHPGLGGLSRLWHQCAETVQSGGIKALRYKFIYHERIAGLSLTQGCASGNDLLMLEELDVDAAALPADIAVHVHLYYADLAPEFSTYLAHIPLEYACYVTTDSPEKAQLIHRAFCGLPNIQSLDIRVVENRGRDIAPLLVALGAELAKHEIVLHLHSKRSPHNYILRGWRRYLLESLLGNSRRVNAILQQFARDPSLGILFPKVFKQIEPCMNIGGNSENMLKLLVRAGKDQSEIDGIRIDYFPAGSMFWFRGSAIEPLVKMNLTLQDFEPESGQSDGTLAHAIERLFVYFSHDRGLRTQAYCTRQFDPDSGASDFGWLRCYISSGLIVRPVIIFDHGHGGGTNLYSRMIADAHSADGASVLMCSYMQGFWSVDWIRADDGMKFVTSSIDELFEVLKLSGSRNITLNSLYGYPAIDEVAERIIALVASLRATLEYKAHDFYGICPSPHLLNFDNKYCAVPADHATCTECLAKNRSWYIEGSWADDISEWRRPFSRLIEAANTINFFDASTIDIYRQAFHFEDGKISVTPHNDDYFECQHPIDLSGPLHIGVLGTLTMVKGGAVINALSEYIGRERKRIPITVIGQSMVPTDPRITILGPYDVNELPDIVRKNRINVILMPTIVPETFSYTISEAMKMRIPIVAFDLGAQGNRVKQYQLGKVIPLNASPAIILGAIQSVLQCNQQTVEKQC